MFRNHCFPKGGEAGVHGGGSIATAVYGNVDEPTNLDAGNIAGNARSRAGGGAIKLDVSGNVMLNGTIRVDSTAESLAIPLAYIEMHGTQAAYNTEAGDSGCTGAGPPDYDLVVKDNASLECLAAPHLAAPHRSIWYNTPALLLFCIGARARAPSPSSQLSPKTTLPMNKLPIPTLADVARRAEAGDPLTVVFFGGSLTWGANASDPNRTSYRALMGEKLRAHFPRARWRFVDAAIGGTGSGLGIFRVERDVLTHKPDLVFLDFTLNDGMTSIAPRTLSSYEAIVRTLLERGHCPVMPVILCSKDFATLPDLADLPRRTHHLALAEYYGLTVGDVVLGMNTRYKAGDLDPDTLWPADLFDTCHPYDPGYAVYADIVWDAFLRGIEANTPIHVPDAWMNSDAYRHTLRYELSSLPTLPQGWRIGKPEIRAGTFDFLASRWMDRVAIAENCTRTSFDHFELTSTQPDPLHLTFCGSSLMIFLESTIFSGEFDLILDGTPKHFNAHAFADTFSPSSVLYFEVASDLDPDTPHSLTLQPILSSTTPQQLHLNSLCIAGPKPVALWQE